MPMMRLGTFVLEEDMDFENRAYECAAAERKCSEETIMQGLCSMIRKGISYVS